MNPTDSNNQFGPGPDDLHKGPTQRLASEQLKKEIAIMAKSIIRKSQLMLDKSNASTATNILGRQVKKKLAEAMEILREFN